VAEEESEFVKLRRRTWARLICKVYLDDPSLLRSCQKPMRIISAPHLAPSGRGHRENTAAPSTVASPLADRAQGPRSADSDFRFKHHHVRGAPFFSEGRWRNFLSLALPTRRKPLHTCGQWHRPAGSIHRPPQRREPLDPGYEWSWRNWVRTVSVCPGRTRGNPQGRPLAGAHLLTSPVRWLSQYTRSFRDVTTETLWLFSRHRTDTAPAEQGGNFATEYFFRPWLFSIRMNRRSWVLPQRRSC
jgi:hypothetical protein